MLFVFLLELLIILGSLLFKVQNNYYQQWEEINRFQIHLGLIY